MWVLVQFGNPIFFDCRALSGISWHSAQGSGTSRTSRDRHSCRRQLAFLSFDANTSTHVEERSNGGVFDIPHNFPGQDEKMSFYCFFAAVFRSDLRLRASVPPW